MFWIALFIVTVGPYVLAFVGFYAACKVVRHIFWSTR